MKTMTYRNRFAALAASAVVVALAGACKPDLNITNPKRTRCCSRHLDSQAT
jgi:hypothetical protein